MGCKLFLCKHYTLEGRGCHHLFDQWGTWTNRGVHCGETCYSMVLMIVLQVLVFVLGLAVVLGTLLSAVRTFVLPRSARDALSFGLFRFTRFLFGLVTKRAN